MKNWWEDFFDDTLGDVILTKNTKVVFDFVETFLPPMKKLNVFDQCCGKGYLSKEFSKQGYTVWGVDINKNYIDFANNNFKSENCSFICDDVKHFTSQQKFDVAINWNSSFAYEDDDCENFKMIAALSKNLSRGGQFFLSTINADFIRKNLIKFLNRDYEKDGMLYKCTKESFIEDNMMKAYWHVECPDGQKITKYCQQKLYTLNDLKKEFLKYNLLIENVYGSLSFDACTDRSGSLIIYGRKY